MSTALCVGVGFAVLAAVVVAMGAILSAERRKNKELEKEVRIKQKELEAVFEYESETQKIKNEKSSKEKEVQNAKSDKDILDCVNSVIADNNSVVDKQLRNKSKK